VSKTAPGIVLFCALTASLPAMAGFSDQLPNGPRQQYGAQNSTLSLSGDLRHCKDQSETDEKRLRYCQAMMAAGPNAFVADTTAGIYERRSELNMALRDYTIAKGLSANDSVAIVGICRVRAISAKEIEAVAQDCAAALQPFAADHAALETQGIIQYRQKQPDAALNSFNAALAGDVATPYALYLRGVIEAQKGNAAAGDGDVQAALRLDPGVKQRLADNGF
jgi:tetratricopeptide (TPR) repeat protein